MTDSTQLPLCVNCRRAPADAEWRPFCSKRCKLADLARWADGSYRVPGEAVPEPSESENSEGRTEKD